MTVRADAHIHLFEHGYNASFNARPGVEINEVECYRSLRMEYGIERALVVGYAAQPWCAGNNDFVAGLAKTHDWIRPTVYVDPTKPITPEMLERFSSLGYVGVSLYAFDPRSVSAVGRIDDEVWRWISQRRWLVSVNAGGDTWAVFAPILERHGGLRLLLSHLGLPETTAQPCGEEQARASLAGVVALARHEQVRVKLSGFYAVASPGHDYPHVSAWPLVRVLYDAYGVKRLMWGSDFSPHLDSVTFPQTFGLFEKMPFLNAGDRRLIEGENLIAMLDEVD
jgi:L-fucono-1,5-lactonase